MEKILFISPSTPCRKSWIIIGVSMLIVVLGFLSIYRVHLANNISTVMLDVTILFCVGCFVLAFISAPHKFILTNSHFIIKRHLKDSVIPLQNIKVLRLMTPAEKKKYYFSDGMSLHGPWSHYPTKRKSRYNVQISG